MTVHLHLAQHLAEAQAKWNEFSDANAGLWPKLSRNQQKIAEVEILSQQVLEEAEKAPKHRAMLGKTWTELGKYIDKRVKSQALDIKTRSA